MYLPRTFAEIDLSGEAAEVAALMRERERGA